MLHVVELTRSEAPSVAALVARGVPEGLAAAILTYLGDYPAVQRVRVHIATATIEPLQ